MKLDDDFKAWHRKTFLEKYEIREGKNKLQEPLIGWDVAFVMLILKARCPWCFYLITNISVSKELGVTWSCREGQRSGKQSSRDESITAIVDSTPSMKTWLAEMLNMKLDDDFKAWHRKTFPEKYEIREGKNKLQEPLIGWDAAFVMLILKARCPWCFYLITNISVSKELGVTWSCREGCNP